MVGEFEDRVYAIFMQSCFLSPTQVTMDDDDDTLHGMAQTTVPYTDRILKAMNRHILNGDML